MVCVFIQCYILTVYYLIIIPMLVPVEELGGTVNQPRKLGGTNGEVLYNDIERASVVLVDQCLSGRNTSSEVRLS